VQRSAHGEAREVKLGGFNEPTQDVSGGVRIGEERDDYRLGAGRRGGDTCPTPGMLMMVAFDRFAAAAFAPAREVNVSSCPR